MKRFRPDKTPLSPKQRRRRMRLLIVFFSTGMGACIATGISAALVWMRGVTPQDAPADFLSGPVSQLGAVGLLLTFCYFFIRYFMKKAEQGDVDRIAEKNQTIKDRDQTIRDRDAVIQDQRGVIDHLKTQNRTMLMLMQSAGLSPPSAEVPPD